MVRTIDPDRTPQKQLTKRKQEEATARATSPQDSQQPQWPQQQQEGEKKQEEKQSVLIIGLGLAGCTAAHFICDDDRYDVTCFEQMAVPGLFAHSVQENASPILDMPLRAVSPHYYSNLFRLYAHMGIDLEQTNYEHCVIDLDTSKPLFSYVNFCIFGRAIPFPALWLAGSFVSAALVLLGFLQFIFLTPWLLFWRRASIELLTLEEYMNKYNFNREFQDCFFVPMFSTLLSCSYRQVQQYPAVLIAEFCVARVSTLFTGWWRVKNVGVIGVAKKLLKGAEGKCHFGVKVLSVASKKVVDSSTGVERQCVEVGYQQVETTSPAASTSVSAAAMVNALSSSSSSGGASAAAATAEGRSTAKFRTFDHVICAVEPDVAKRIIVTDQDTAEGRGCSAFLNSTSSFTADIVAHRDSNFMANFPLPGLIAQPANGSGSAAASTSSSNSNNGNGHINSFSTTTTKGAAAATTGEANTSSSSDAAGSSSSMFASPQTGLTIFSTAADAAATDPSKFNDAPRNASTTTGNMAVLYAGSASECNGRHCVKAGLFETWNPVGKPKHILKHARMTRAVWTVEGLQTANRYARHSQGLNNIWFCGSWAARGVTLLEQAASSALDVVQDFDVKLPFYADPSDLELNASWWLVLVSMAIHVWIGVIRLWWWAVGSPTLFVGKFVVNAIHGLKGGHQKRV